MFGIGEASHFKFRMLIDTKVYTCTHNRLSLKGSRDLFQFLEISGNISSLVQDRHSYNWRLIRNLCVAYQMAPLWVTFSDLEGHFCCLKPLCPSATVVCVHDGVLTEQYAESTTTLVVVDVGWPQLWSSWHEPDSLYGKYGGLLMTRTALHGRYEIVVPSVYQTMQYAYNGIKHGSCW